MRVVLKIGGFLLTGVLLFFLGSNLWIVGSTFSDVHADYQDLPSKKTGLVLGTSKKLKTGESNPFFENRIDAAVDLYNANKISHVLVSGDNGSRYYNEPVDMLNALLNAGVPREAITLDYAGFRTFDSIIRCKKIFDQDSIYIITQKFHSYRALFIANQFGINATAYTAQKVDAGSSIEVIMRELFARPKAILDIFFLNQQPAYLGKKEKLPV